MEILGAGGAQPTVRESLAFADDVGGTLFSNAYFRLGGQSASDITSYSQQASALKKRLNKTQPWLQSLGKEAYASESDFSKRVLSVSSDSIADTGVNAQNEIYSVATAGNFLTTTAAIAATEGKVTLPNPPAAGDLPLQYTASSELTLTNAALAASDVGNTIVVNGVSYTITAVTGALTATVSPGVVQDIAPTTNYYLVRRNLTRSHQGRNKIYVLWQPPLGIFDSSEPMGAGDYRIELNPNANFRTSMVETRNDQSANPATYTVNILDVKFYLYTMKMSIPNQVSTMHLMECNIQSKVYATNLQFSIPSSTKAITVFIQAAEAGTDGRYPPSMFKAIGDTDLNLNTLQISYAGLTKTVTPWQSNFQNNNPAGRNTNLLLQRYRDSMVESGMSVEAVGCESFDSWLQRGPIYHFDWSRDMHNRSTEVQLTTNFSPAIDPTSKVFIAAWYTNGLQYTTNNGLIVEVTKMNV